MDGRSLKVPYQGDQTDGMCTAVVVRRVRNRTGADQLVQDFLQKDRIPGGWLEPLAVHPHLVDRHLG